ncbi:MAG: succinate dehydrogenase [Veillonellaceae bacterium]|jgi:succinate dehydrogenase / fumarate reductase cytochrome b subunit|nr:succinate dehydrogenase [Veillonellaceae bacterium]
MNNNLDFYIRRVHSISGLVPIGFFLLEHIFSISTVLGGGAAFDATVAKLAAIPAEIMLPLEIFAIAIPFLFHAIYGLYITFNAKNNQGDYGYVRNWQFYLQRMTALYLAVFLIWHVGYLRIMLKGSGVPINYDLMHGYLSNPIVLVLYCIGIVAAIFHFTNGLFTMSITWGVTVGPRAQAFANKIAWGLCAVLSIVAVMATIAFAS